MPRTRGAVRLSAGLQAPVAAPAPDRSVASSAMASKRQSLRRAASAAPALPPTPPRTTHKRKRRSRSRVTDSSSEEEEEHAVPVVESDGEERGSSDPQRKVGALVLGHKKRRMLTLDAIAEELNETATEDAFWLGNGPSSSSNRRSDVASGESQPPQKVLRNRAPTRARSRTRSPSSSPPPAPHLLRKGHTGLFSPPPSRRAPAVAPRPATPPPAPQSRKQKEKVLPERDSPNNPFLFGDSPGALPPSDELSSPEPRTPKKHVEKPTVTYVFRGVRTVLANPHYRSPGGSTEVAEAEARAQLPAEHPDFSPSEACEPTLLFPQARKAEHARRRAHVVLQAPSSPTPRAGKRRADSTSGDELRGGSSEGRGKAPEAAPRASAIADVEDADAMAAALAMRVATRMRKGIYADGLAPRTRPSSSAGDVPHLPEKDRSDPMKRAMGPARPA
ncbi:hypothetical protein BC628DRAFT_1338467 [Trametes gibbosa]|nr:hypothetical protein BC628DRAFT_1338467 [Trametes gibbosa]